MSTFAPMINAAIFASGEGTNAENLFKHFANDPRIRIKLVVCNNRQAGVIAKAQRYKKTVHIASRESFNKYATELVEMLRSEGIDLIILSGFLLKLPEVFIEAFRGKIINIHPALLPKFGGRGMYGMNVHRAVIDAGEKESGITIHYVDEEYDRGDVILQMKCPIEPGETPETLAAKVRDLELTWFPKAIEKFLE